MTITRSFWSIASALFVLVLGLSAAWQLVRVCGEVHRSRRVLATRMTGDEFDEPLVHAVVGSPQQEDASSA